MDNNPFRSQNPQPQYTQPQYTQSQYTQSQYSQPQYTQPQYPQSQYSQQFPQQQQQQIQENGLYQNPNSLQQQFGYGNNTGQNSPLQQQSWSGQGAYASPPVSQFPPQTSFTMNNSLTSYSQPQSSMLPTTTGYLQQQQQISIPQYSQYGTDSFNMNIPPNFGMSITPSYQPKHTPVDASTLLKGTEIRRIACPVCQKMLEGDDMAINHHVNEHYS